MVERNPKHHHIAEPVPADFDRYVAVETVERLAGRYGRSLETVRKWRIQCGFVGRSGFDVAATGRQPLAPNPLPSGDDTVTQRAAQWLRKHGRIGNVFNCGIRLHEQGSHTWGDRYNWTHKVEEGFKPLPSGGAGYYMVDGKGVMTAEGMTDLARSLGFKE